VKEKTLGEVAQEAFRRSDALGGLVAWWEETAAAVVAEHERRKWQPMRTCPACGEEIIAGYRNGEEWIQTMGDATTLRTFPEYTHWQYAPEGPK